VRSAAARPLYVSRVSADSPDAFERSDRARRLALVVNVRSGPNRALTMDRLREIHEALKNAGLAASVRIVAPHDVEAAVERAAESGADAVIVGGGDGPVAGAAARLVGTRCALGVLPLGTWNHFARDLGMPVGLGAAIAWLAGAKPKAVDVGAANGVVFLNNVSIGLYPRAVRLRDEAARRGGWGRAAATALAVVGALRRFPSLELRVEVDGRETVVRTPVVFVGNNVYGTEGDGFGRRTALDQGVLGTVIVEVEGRVAFLKLLARAVLGLRASADPVRRLTASRVVVASRGPALSVALDGERRSLASPVEITTRPRALWVLARSA
jgi:diacylglycerol kinase family enzyme